MDGRRGMASRRALASKQTASDNAQRNSGALAIAVIACGMVRSSITGIARARALRIA